MCKRALTVLLVLFICNAYSQTYPIINSERPRIYLDVERIDWIRDNINVNGAFKNTYLDFKYRYAHYWINDPELYLEGSDSSLWNWNWNSQYAKDEAIFTTFIFKIEQNQLAEDRMIYLTQKVIDALHQADYNAMDYYEKEAFIRKFSDVGSLILDWCYDTIPVQMRQQLVHALFNMNTELMNSFILTNEGDSYVTGHNVYNCVFANQNALVLYNADGLTTAQNNTIQQWYELIYDKWINGFLPVYDHYRGEDGGWNWGGAYSIWALIDQYQFFDNMLIGTGKNFYAELPWLLNSINQYWYFIRPDKRTIHWGDGQTHIVGDRVIYRHAAVYNDPRSVWLAQEYALPENNDYTVTLFQQLLFKDFTLPTISKPILPLNWFSPETGLSVSRSSWEKDAVMTTFSNNPNKSYGHQHRDNNSFTVFKNTPLLLDAGYYDAYGSSHYVNYYQRTVAHNGICVFDSEESFYNYGQPVSNDGGQIGSQLLLNYDDIFLPKYQRGNWIKYATGVNYQYNVADAQQSYNTDKLDFFRRKFLFVKPNKIIVLDNIHLNNTVTEQREAKWIAHFVNRPQINGNLTATEVLNHIETFDGKDYISINGTGSVAIRTLLPEATNTTLIGGTEYEYWVNGVNYPLNGDVDTLSAPGNWRIEVQPNNVSDSITYLHTIAIGDDNTIAESGGLAHKNDFSVGSDWDDTLYYFAANTTTEINHHIFYNVPGGRNVSIFATDLVLGNYDIVVDGMPINNSETDAFGILQSQITLNHGNHTVEIVSTLLNINESVKNSLFKIVQNPTNFKLNLLLADGFVLGEVKVYSTEGRLLISKYGLSSIDVSFLPQGMYFVTVQIEDKIYTKKFIKN